MRDHDANDGCLTALVVRPSFPHSRAIGAIFLFIWAATPNR